MTTELVLLLAIFAFVIGGVFFGEKGPIATFEKSGPRLGARLEKQLSTGRSFKNKGSANEWIPPSSKAPTGQL